MCLLLIPSQCVLSPYVILQFTASEKPQTDVVLKTRATPWMTGVCQEKDFLVSGAGKKAAAVQQAKNTLNLGGLNAKQLFIISGSWTQS